MASPSETLLSDVLANFARTLITDFTIHPILDELVQRIVEVLPITSAGLMLISPGCEPRYVVASDDLALRCEELQTEVGEGPGIMAHRSGTAVAVVDLRNEPRFSVFAPRAVEMGLAAAFAFPLRHGYEQLGELNLYRDTPGPLSAASMETAQTLADVAAGYLFNAQVRADLTASAARSRELALHDPLTGLPNRTLFLERLEHAVMRGRRSGNMAAVLFADLDHFKLVNDVYGHSVGDELLVEVANRLRTSLRSGDTVARMSGDEFVILCEDLDLDVDKRSLVDAIAARIGATVATQFVLSSHEVNITASVGIAFSGTGDQLSEHLLRDADAAMYQAKRNGGAQHQIIDTRERYLASLESALERELRGAAARGELRTEYQPIVDSSDGRITGVEALVRWAHPSRGLVAPSVLVPAAERAGLITEVGAWVLEKSCADRNAWHIGATEHEQMTISVNVSAHQLISPDYPASVAAALYESGTNPRLLTLEVTESVCVQDGERALATLKELKQLGVRLALDDFGTGYSSLSYLKRFPIDIVKIDQGFVADLHKNQTSFAIISAVIDLAHMLGMTVVAEGVETLEQYEQLSSLGCDSCQGFYFARPMAADDFDSLVRRCNFGGSVHLPTLAMLKPASTMFADRALEVRGCG